MTDGQLTGGQFVLEIQLSRMDWYNNPIVIEIALRNLPRTLS